jgi:hypothetical protein
MKQKMIDAIKAHAKGHIKKHTMNVEVYLNNPVGVGEHPDIIEAIEKELDMVAKYHDQLEVIKNYIEKDPLKPNVQ